MQSRWYRQSSGLAAAIALCASALIAPSTARAVTIIDFESEADGTALNAQIPGDTEVYDIVHDSLLIVRTGSGEKDIRAYVNSCLHRGTILRTEGGNVRHIKCPVHSMT